MMFVIRWATYGYVTKRSPNRKPYASTPTDPDVKTWVYEIRDLATELDDVPLLALKDIISKCRRVLRILKLDPDAPLRRPKLSEIIGGVPNPAMLAAAKKAKKDQGA